MRFLCFHCHRSDRPGDQPAKSDGLASHFAIPVFALVNPAQGRIYLRDQLALPVPGSQFDAPVGLARRPVVQIGLAYGAVLKLLQRSRSGIKNGFLPG